MHDRQLAGLRLGVATSALQIEGGSTNSTWYEWWQDGHIADDTSPECTTQHWRLYAEDAALMAAMGIRDYRMSLDWGRLEPSPGRFDDAALAHYRDELTLLHSLGVRTIVTLHHFNNPPWFERQGAFLTAQGVPSFLRYVRYCVEGLGDLVDGWITINEPNVFATGSYLYAMFPPGGTSMATTMRCFNWLAAAHIKAYQLIHAIDPTAQVGICQHLRSFAPLNPQRVRDRAAARTSRYLFQDAITDAMCRGDFRRPLRNHLGVPRGRYYDFLGLNYYTRTTTAGIGDGVRPRAAVTDMGWEIHPDGLVENAEWLLRRYPDVPLYVTENGCCDLDDTFRSRYIYDHLVAMLDSGLPIERYYHWCFVDNWEWDKGEYARFGLVHNDFATQRRTVKDSGRFYSEVIRTGALTADLYQRYVAHQEYPRNE